MAKGGLVIVEDTLTPGLRSFAPKLQRAITTTVDYFAPQVQNYARTNAPWTDRTGNARQGLFAETEHGAGRHSIILAHSMPYGIWLEVRFEGRYAIIEPTIKAQGAALMAFLRGVLGRMS